PAPLEKMDVGLHDLDLFQQGVPHETFAELRATAPVSFHHDPASPGFWSVHRHADVVAVNRDNATFSSNLKATLFWEMEEADLAQQRLMMLNMDPPIHTRYRRLVNKGFTPRMVGDLETHIREMTSTILDEATAKGELDFVTDVSAELPLQVIAELMGVPHEERHLMFDWSNRMVGAQDPEYGVLPEEASQAAMELFAYAHQLAEQKRINPHDDLISVLSTCEVDGERLSELEIDLFFMLLTVAGNETTRNLISHGMQALMEHPDQYALLREDPSLVDSAVEEMLRWASPVMHFRRTASRDCEIGGQPIAQGDKVVIWYISANRDEKVWDDPYTFDITRQDNQHVSFGGGGPHFCLGANLARMEARVMFREIIERFEIIEPAGDVARLRSNFINGIKHLPVRVKPV
ncbi:MAG: cholest-4-en-3-one 26-monooxygenase, partial [Actinomycetota bacterium]|nr:cholest-4-en-3-one 26-monooxygenase [Actinomycetota bacterium]